MIVVDANSIVKLVVTEDNSETAFEVIGAETAKREPILAPDIILAESLNALWVNFAKKGKISAEQLDQAEAAVVTVFGNLKMISTRNLEHVAVQVSKKHGLSVYDSLYVAAGLLNDAPLFTFDKKIRRMAKAIGVNLVDY